MKPATIKKQVNEYFPMLSPSQQALVLDMIKGLLQVDGKEKRVSLEQYNQELQDAVDRIENGESIPHDEALNRLSKW